LFISVSQEEISKAENAAVAAAAFTAGEKSSAMLFRGRMLDALRATVIAAEAEEKKAYAELQYEPNNVCNTFAMCPKSLHLYII
jgi:hypothetical protein